MLPVKQNMTFNILTHVLMTTLLLSFLITLLLASAHRTSPYYTSSSTRQHNLCNILFPHHYFFIKLRSLRWLCKGLSGFFFPSWFTFYTRVEINFQFSLLRFCYPSTNNYLNNLFRFWGRYFKTLYKVKTAGYVTWLFSRSLLVLLLLPAPTSQRFADLNP